MVYQSDFMLRFFSQLPIYSNLSLKTPGNILVLLVLVGRITKVFQVKLQTSLHLHLWPDISSCPFFSSSSCLLFTCTHVFLLMFHRPSIPTDALPAVSAHLLVVCVGGFCSLPGVSWQVELLLQREVRKHCCPCTQRSVISLPDEQWLRCSFIACLLRPTVQIIVYFQGDVGRT